MLQYNFVIGMTHSTDILPPHHLYSYRLLLDQNRRTKMKRFIVGHYSRGHYGDHYAIHDIVDKETFGDFPWSNHGKEQAQKLADKLNGLGEPL